MFEQEGRRLKFGVMVPSTNTVVQTEFARMRPGGVSNHVSRIHIPDRPLTTEADFAALMERVQAELMAAVDRVITCRPHALIMGMSAETFWDGPEASARLAAGLAARSGGLDVTLASDAFGPAIRAHGDIRRLAVLTPYQKAGEDKVIRFFEGLGFEVVAVGGVQAPGPVEMADLSPRIIRDALIRLNDPAVEAIVQLGTNLPMARLAAVAEFWLDKPVIAVNTALYWHALRRAGIMDRIEGFGALLAAH
ncbi:arylmalonate decarboxylase (plasmid) [Tistrella mobilis]|uniref:maleate cis-trans isomerase family protein n=1 Tax=Tistrella mobilis TaxID=171437 RepID=UPI0035577B8B